MWGLINRDRHRLTIHLNGECAVALIIAYHVFGGDDLYR